MEKFKFPTAKIPRLINSISKAGTVDSKFYTTLDVKEVKKRGYAKAIITRDD